MRLALAGFALESVTFMPGETTLADFEAQALRGEAWREALAGTASVGGGLLAGCRHAGVEAVPLVYTDAGAGPPASEEAYRHYLDEVADGVLSRIKSLDGLVLFLHGALTTPERPHADADFVRELRARIGERLPITLAMDLHGNLHPELRNHVLALFGYRHSPHIDQSETGERAVWTMVHALRGDLRPRWAMRKVPLVLPSIFTATALSPLRELLAEARALEEDDSAVLDVSVFTGFAYADVPQIGFSVVVVSDGDEALAERVAAQLAGRVWGEREALYRPLPVHGMEEGVALGLKAARDAEGPVVLLEHADRGNDSTYVLRELLERARAGDVFRAAVPYLCDPPAARMAVDAAVGNTIAMEVGGLSSPQAGGPLAIEGKVLWAGEKSYVGTGPMRKGVPVNLGLSALIECGTESGGTIQIILTSANLSAIDTDPFLQFGLDPASYDLIVLRSKTHFRAAYEAIAEEILIIDTPDWGPADLTTLPYRRARSGVYPISHTTKRD